MSFNRYKHLYGLFFFGFLIVFMFSTLYIINMSTIKVDNTTFLSKKGQIDLSQWDDHNTIYSLNGEWEFYPNELITSHTLSDQSMFTNVPSSWSYSFLPKEYKGQASYRIIVQLPTSMIGKYVGIRTTNIRQNYRIFIDGVLLFANGDLSNPDEYIPPAFPQTTYFEVKNEKIELIIHVSNNYLNNPGINHSVLIGYEYVVRNLSMTKNNMDVILFATLLSVSLFLLLFFFIFRSNQSKNYDYLGLSINTFFFALATAGYREKLLFQFLFRLDSATLFWLHDFAKIGYYLSLFVLFYRARKNEYPKLIFLMVLAYLAFLSCIVLVLPISVYGAYFDFLTLSLYGLFGIIVLLELKIVLQDNTKWTHSIYVFSLVSLPALYAYTILIYQSTNIWFDVLINISIIFFVFFMLSHTFLDGINTINRNYALSEEVLRNEFAFLQSQIKPHFIFNTFSSIQSMIDIDSNKAQELILHLSDYLRGAFDFNPEHIYVTLEKELEHVRTYLAIEKERYGERFSVEYHIDESLLLSLILQYSIQPLVENALRHGILVRSKPGLIKIFIFQEHTNINVIIEDNGVGCDVHKIYKYLNSETQKRGVGLRNIHKRLINRYGQGLKIESVVGEGTKVTFVIPIFSKEIL